MSPKSKKKKQASSSSSSSSLEKYQNMTLDELAELDDAHDEEIDEEEAFNSEDERVYGQYLSAAKTKIRSENLSLSISFKYKDGRDFVPRNVEVEIARGSKMTLSSVCLDMSECNSFNQVKLMYRCMYPDDDQKAKEEDENSSFSCLCNYLSVKNGGMGLMPSTPVNLEVVGPCKVEFKKEIVLPLGQKKIEGRINIFGIIVPTDHVFSDDSPFRYADAFMSEEEEKEEIEPENESIAESASATNNKNGNADKTSKQNGEASKATKKRKLDEDEEEVPSGKPTKAAKTEPDTPSADSKSNADTKLSKSQRKKLAKKKAKELEDTLSAARNETSNNTGDDDATEDNNNNNEASSSSKKKSKKKKKKSASSKEEEQSSKPTSLTRERRLPGGLVVSDILLGTGPPVKSGKRISLHYTGKLQSSGKVFDKNHSKQHPLQFRQGTGEVIRGLERGLDGMKSGGERMIRIPSNLGYGSKGAGVDIPPDSDLVFEVKVLKVG
eukprot:CAMPEP_0183715812 /NCGR_PEP_ID=MMETSP0737-20130205/9911_1 /TAXON_ID=385413 /ORGANISM="Thalassiosira miniscula, Strain CCMP1093" /LENGTH=495 /DNA_ID=CAMNT_0025944969 /DNA_START=200 /DNA_END=1687 /DNA_ORIENTATION=+